MNIFERAAPHESYAQEFARLIDRAASPIYGDIAKWKSQTGLPSFMCEIVVRDSYDQHCLDLASEKARGMEGVKQVQYLRDTERIVLRNAGLPENLSRDFRLAMQDRTMMKSEKGWTVPLWRGGKVNPAAWKTALTAIVAHLERVGDDVMTELHDQCGIVNFDRYTAEQLEFMDRFLRGDEETIQGLRNTDVVVAMTDAFGDHNHGLSAMPSLFDTKTSTLFFEVARPTDIYRHFIKMRRSGVTPSTLALGVHGAPGSMVFGDGENKFSLGTMGVGRRSYNLGRTSAGRLARDYMRPDRTNDSRSIILASCSQGKAEFCRPTAHVLARRFDPADNVVVSASRHVGYEARDGSGKLRFYSDSRPVNTIEFRSTGRRFGTERIETQRLLGTR